jgi:sugar O-acyltransferase (sialic acid O-acetyltransferase NeuD family)
MNKKKIIIIGYGSHAKVIFSEIIKLKKYKIAGFIDPFSKAEYHEYKNKRIKIFREIKELQINNLLAIIAIGNNFKRKKVFNEIKKKNILLKWINIISKDSIINNNVKIGNGSFIASGVTINNDTVIGQHCIINTNSSIDHDNQFKDFSSCAPGVTTGGNVSLGELSHLGIGCSVNHKIIIGKNTIIGGQSFVNKNCSSNSTYYGVPIKKSSKKINRNYL